MIPPQPSTATAITAVRRYGGQIAITEYYATSCSIPGTRVTAIIIIDRHTIQVNTADVVDSAPTTDVTRTSIATSVILGNIDIGTKMSPSL